MKMNKINWVITTFVISLMLFPTVLGYTSTAFNPELNQISLDPMVISEIKPGEKFKVVVKAQIPSGVNSKVVKYKLSYDPKLVELINTESSLDSSFNFGSGFKTDILGEIVFQKSCLVSCVALNGQVNLAVINFKVSSDATSSSSTLINISDKYGTDTAINTGSTNYISKQNGLSIKLSSAAPTQSCVAKEATCAETGISCPGNSVIPTISCAAGQTCTTGICVSNTPAGSSEQACLEQCEVDYEFCVLDEGSNCDNPYNDCLDACSTCLDTDADGYYTFAECGNLSVADCNDNNNAINPGITETPCNGVDEDCNPSTTCAGDLTKDDHVNQADLGKLTWTFVKGNIITLNKYVFNIAKNWGK